MTCFSQELHPIYGAVPGDGDFVEAGEILGLSPDAGEVITAPQSGWVRLIFSPASPPQRLVVEVWQDRRELEQKPAADRVA
jgi:hypothetical protein